MKYTMTTPCTECPFRRSMRGFTVRRLQEFASGEFPCHKTAEHIDGEDGGIFQATDESQH